MNFSRQNAQKCYHPAKATDQNRFFCYQLKSFQHKNFCSRNKYLRKNSKTQMTKILNIINHRQLHSEPILPERYRGMLGLDIRRCLRVWCRSCGGCRSR